MPQHIRCKSAASARSLGLFCRWLRYLTVWFVLQKLLEAGQKSQAQARSSEFGFIRAGSEKSYRPDGDRLYVSRHVVRLGRLADDMSEPNLIVFHAF